MPANTTPIFPLTAQAACVNISTANTNRDGTGTIGTVLTAGSNGTRIDRVVIQATATTTAGVVRLFIYTGSTYFLLSETLVSAITPSATVRAFSTTLVFDRGLILPSGYSLRASTHNAESFNVIAIAGDY
jgi:hypothetical protein